MRCPMSFRNLLWAIQAKGGVASLAALLVLIITAIALAAGCSRERSQTSGTNTERQAVGSDDKTHSEGKVPAEGNPQVWGFPPEQGEPWPIRMSSDPLSPTRDTSTGEPNVRWPDYRVPREIIFTAPPVPSEIVGPGGTRKNPEAAE
ncbi:hypothetical protein [Thermogutta sp.]|uniref:hypothetical protein n=1 Tax=Thermogutta sp. TaxID=1962930 RepID=UPI00321F6D29